MKRIETYVLNGDVEGVKWFLRFTSLMMWSIGFVIGIIFAVGVRG